MSLSNVRKLFVTAALFSGVVLFAADFETIEINLHGVLKITLQGSENEGLVVGTLVARTTPGEGPLSWTANKIELEFRINKNSNPHAFQWTLHSTLDNPEAFYAFLRSEDVRTYARTAEIGFHHSLPAAQAATLKDLFFEALYARQGDTRPWLRYYASHFEAVSTHFRNSPVSLRPWMSHAPAGGKMLMDLLARFAPELLARASDINQLAASRAIQAHTIDGVGDEKYHFEIDSAELAQLSGLPVNAPLVFKATGLHDVRISYGDGMSGALSPFISGVCVALLTGGPKDLSKERP
jgi:hypothetical protein